MNTLVNIVHPYSYKLVGEYLSLDPIEQFKERDEKICRFVNTAIKNKIKVLVHWNKPAIHPQREREYVSFLQDPNYQFIFNESIKNVTTYVNGLPLADKKPKKTSKKEWQMLTYFYIQHSQLSKKIGNPEKTLVIGGQIDRCLANFIIYLNTYHQNLKNKIYYVPELSVPCEAEKVPETEGKFHELGVSFLTFKEAIDMITIQGDQ